MPLFVPVSYTHLQVNDYLQRCGLDSEHLICHCEEKELLVSYIEDILRHNTLSYSNELYIQGILFLIFASFSRSADIKYKSDFTSENIHISKAIEFIQKNYQNVITVRDIADYVSLNRSYLCSMFQKNLHMSPQQFLLRFRITKATELDVYKRQLHCCPEIHGQRAYLYLRLDSFFSVDRIHIVIDDDMKTPVSAVLCFCYIIFFCLDLHVRPLFNNLHNTVDIFHKLTNDSDARNILQIGLDFIDIDLFPLHLVKNAGNTLDLSLIHI